MSGPTPFDVTPVDEVVGDLCVGDPGTIGQCKWFNPTLGYGFLTICNGEDVGRDIFVHHSGIKPVNSMYRTLWKGEYVSFSIATGSNGLQAVNVTGVCGGTLMCDIIPMRRTPLPPPPPFPPPPSFPPPPPFPYS
jgi:cold shock CspA family protein